MLEVGQQRVPLQSVPILRISIPTGRRVYFLTHVFDAKNPHLITKPDHFTGLGKWHTGIEA